MLYNHSEVKKIYKSDYQINRAVEDGKLFKLDKGVWLWLQKILKLLKIQ